MDKTPQIAKEQLVMTMDKAQETKLQRYKSYRIGVFLNYIHVHLYDIHS